MLLLNAPTKTQAIAAYRMAKPELSPATSFVLFGTCETRWKPRSSQRALSLMSSFFAALALFLSGLGPYGLVAITAVVTFAIVAGPSPALRAAAIDPIQALRAE